MSLLRALRGETYTTSMPSPRPVGPADWRARESIAARKAARVLPEPVGAAMSVSRPARISAQPRACAGVGAPNAFVNQAETAG